MTARQEGMQILMGLRSPLAYTREELAELCFDATARLERLERHKEELTVSVEMLNSDLLQIDDNAVYLLRMSGSVYRHEIIKTTAKRVFVRAVEGPLDDQRQVVQLKRQVLEQNGHTSQHRTWFKTYHLSWSYRRILERQRDEKEQERQEVTQSLLEYQTNRDAWYGVPVSDREWETICRLTPEPNQYLAERLDWREFGF